MSKRILIVDDSPDVLLVLSRLLQIAGYEVTAVEGGAAALETFQAQGAPDILILDVLMPEMNGFEVLARARGEQGYTGPVIMLTGLDTEQDIVRGYSQGADYYLTKPFREESLRNIISFLLDETQGLESIL